MKRRTFCQIAWPSLLARPAQAAIEVSFDKQVFLDWELVDPGMGLPYPWRSGTHPLFMPHGVRLSVGRPKIQPEPIITPDCENGEWLVAHATLLQDQGRFRLWYEIYDAAERWPGYIKSVRLNRRCRMDEPTPIACH